MSRESTSLDDLIRSPIRRALLASIGIEGDGADRLIAQAEANLEIAKLAALLADARPGFNSWPRVKWLSVAAVAYSLGARAP